VVERRVPGQPGRSDRGVEMRYELLGGAHARLARMLSAERGQGTVEYVGLVLLVAVLIAGVVKASGGFSDTGIAEAVVKKLKGAIDGVGEG
jgi:Flp pilus assembly pilin Flp